MNRLFLALLFCVASATLAAELPPHLLLELSDDAALAVRTEGAVLPQVIAELNLPEAELRPIFYEPRDAFKHADWFAFGLHRFFRLKWQNEDAEAVAAALRGAKSADLLTISVSYPLRADIEPNDYRIHSMWGLDAMRCPAAWERHHGDREIIVTTIDTGCNIGHPDLAANIYINPLEDLNHNGVWDASDIDSIDNDSNGFVDDLSGWDFVDHGVNEAEVADGEEYAPRDNRVFPDVHGHGTHVMGTAAGVTDNNTGVAAASWNVRALPLRAGFAWLEQGQWLQGSGYTEDFLAAIQYAVDNGARVISISFGGSAPDPGYPPVINYARANNVLIFAAAGNNGNSQPNYPGAFGGLVGVAATQIGDVKANFSTFGDWVDISAPGVDIWSTMANNVYHAEDYSAWSGTSMATPNAAAVAGLMLSANPDLTEDQVEQYLYAASDNIEMINPGFIGLIGAGRVNAENAVALAQGDTLPSPDFAGIVLDDVGGVVTMAWQINLRGHADLLRYRIYRDGQLVDSTTWELATNQLPQRGRYRLGVSAVFSSGESITKYAELVWSSTSGFPFADDFENDLSQWQQEGSVEIVAAPVYAGTGALAVYSAGSEVSRVTRQSGGVYGAEAEAWFQISAYPGSNGTTAGISFGDVIGEQSGVSINSSGQPRHFFYPPYPPEVTILDPNVTIDLNRWYHWRVRQQNERFFALLLDDQHNVLINTLVPVIGFPDVTEVSFASAFANSWSYYDQARIRPFTGGELQHFVPTVSTANPYALVITAATAGEESLRPGDEIAIYDWPQCVGAEVCTGDWPLVVNAYQSTGPLPGYEPGNRIEFRIWSQWADFEDVADEQYEVGNGHFGDGTFARASLHHEPFAAGDPPVVAARFALGNAYPNPFNPVATIHFELPATGLARLEVFNTLGQRVATLVDGPLAAGAHQARFDGRALASGVYIYRLSIADRVAQNKMLLLK